MGPGLWLGPGLGSMGSVGQRLSICLGKHATVFQTDVYAILACVHEMAAQDRPEKYISVCPDSQACSESALGCQNNISLGTTVPEGVE